MKEQTRKISKATFEATLSSQERFRTLVTSLIKENRCLRDEQEQSDFLRLAAHSTLGLGTDETILLRVGEHAALRASLEKVIRWAAKQTSNKVFVPLDLNQLHQWGQWKNKPNCDISRVWDALLSSCSDVFANALNTALTMSKEKDESTQSKGYMIENE